MRLLIISGGGYPSYKNPYSGGFVHSRVKEYIRRGEDCLVFIPPNVSSIQDSQYEFDGVVITIGNSNDLQKTVDSFRPDAIAVHFTHPIVFRYLKEREVNIPMIFWVHGYGAIGWFRYIFEMKFGKEYFIDWIVNTRNLILFHFLSKKHESRKIYFVFVSNWMKKVASLDTLSHFTNFKIIPNPIDQQLFSYSPKDEGQRKKILLIRSFANKKYANDIAIKAILQLSHERCFSDLEFAIYGQGKHFEELTKPLRQFSNVKIENKFLLQKEIAVIHKNYGVFLCPTRMDAQGVSMCEAMMSGLVPISSYSTAIPEFVSDNIDGLLTRNSHEIAKKILFLYDKPEIFLQMSLTAHENILKKAGNEITISSELKYIHSLIAERNNLEPLKVGLK